MDNSTNKGDQEKESLQKLDLSGLQDFNFATNWSESPAAPARRERDPAPRGGPRREKQPDRRPAGAKNLRSGGAERKDRRPPSARQSADAGRGDTRHARRERPEKRDERREISLLRESPFEIQIFPEEPIVATLTRAMRHSMRTYALFELAGLVLEKPDRFHLSIRFRDDAAGERVFFQSVPDGLPFFSEEAAVDHVVRSGLDRFFAIEEVEAEPPKGSFQFIARCSLTGDFLCPPNFHRYQPILLQYYQDRFADMPFERFRSHIETVKDEEAIEKWLLSMTKQHRYKLLGTPEEEEQTFDSLEEARAFLLQHRKDKVVRTVKTLRFPGKKMEEIVAPEIRPYLLAYAENQKRFPLDTANALRGRLRRQHFFIHKKGSRGISLVCAVKRKFRQPGQVFSESIQNLIAFIEKNDQMLASRLPGEFLGLPPADEGAEAAPPDPGAEEKVKRLNLDLRWLLSEGYVTEYSDGRLSVHPVVAPEKREKKSRPEKTGLSARDDEPPQPEGEAAETAATETAGESRPDDAPVADGGDSEAAEPKDVAPEPESPASEPAEGFGCQVSGFRKEGTTRIVIPKPES